VLTFEIINKSKNISCIKWFRLSENYYRHFQKLKQTRGTSCKFYIRLY